METQVQIQPAQDVQQAALRAVVEGKVSNLSVEQKIEYLKAVSDQLGLNPVLGAVRFIPSEDGEVLYITAQGLYEIASRHGVSFELSGTEVLGSGDERIVLVKAKARTPDGRQTEAMGTCAVVKTYRNGKTRNVGLADAILIAETKAKLRAIRQLFGLPLSDEEAREVAKVEGKGLEELDTVSTVSELIEVGRRVLQANRHLQDALRVELRRRYEILHQLTGEIADDKFLSFIGLK